jgi:glycerol kinase
MLAGLGAGLFRSLDDVSPLSGTGTRFQPAMAAAERAAHLSRWSSALAKAKLRESKAEP